MNQFWGFYYEYIRPRLVLFLHSKWFKLSIWCLVLIFSLVMCIIFGVRCFN